MESNTAQLGVVGLGYVGSPLASAFASAGHHVVGYDHDVEKIEMLRERSRVSSAGDEHDESSLTYSSDPMCLQACETIITAVPTPLTESSEPDLSMVRTAGRTIGEHLAPGSTVVLESTVYPGATRAEFVPEIERTSDLSLGEDFEVGYSPERINPGDDLGLRHIIKPVSGRTDSVRSELLDLYDDIVDETYPAPTIESAEAAKCLENAQRDLNIALINQFAMACATIDYLEYEDVLSVADTKWNFQRYNPGLVEGHCIPIDPYFLIERLEHHGASASLMREARTVNESVTDHVFQLTIEALNRRRERVSVIDDAERVLVCGLSYKPNVADVRSRAKQELFEKLRTAGIDLVGYDPYVNPEEAADTFDLEMWPSIDIGDVSGLLFLTNHSTFGDLTLDEVVERTPEHTAIIDIAGTFEEPIRSDIIYQRL
ncbi:nucleotide sugar dehydrogenase [Natronococcus pandeyae]|uniref:UDP-N-acetyl-D-mannosamine dehydrogenase n=1 Tax=Natronococcus pandeyae TaxID=2055836 RepID=A0A8J8TND3_9EURY|nr:nucleotide sugar dehydrogenase [Natronococcus pandeyae]TYL36546.1 nucleotide sugar dehydrogenase [Natronococcus pandeyae]